MPQEPGDYLWLEQFECGCVLKSGIAWVYDEEMEDHGSDFSYRAKEGGKSLWISWEGQQPNTNSDGTPCVDYWTEVKLPPPQHH